MKRTTPASRKRRPNNPRTQLTFPKRKAGGSVKESLLAIPKAYDVRKLVKAGTDKRRRKVGAFETKARAEKEHRHRLELLDDHGCHHTEPVHEALYECNLKRRPCGSMACFKCARVRRIKRAASLLDFLAVYPLEDLSFVTLINPSDAFSRHQLQLFEPRKLINRLRRQLDRLFAKHGIDVSQTFLVGGIDCEWDAGWQVYQPHLHLISWGVAKEHLKELVAEWPEESQRVRKRRRSEPIDDLPRVVTYLDKSFWSAIARPNNPVGLHPHRKRRPWRETEMDILAWFHRQSANDLRFSYGVKQYGGELKKT